MKYLLIMISAALLITGCSDGSSSSDVAAPTTKTLIAGECTDVQDGDTLEELEAGTVIEITHDLDGSRTACVISGEALLTFGSDN